MKKIKRYNGEENGSDVSNDYDAEGYGTKLERAAPAEDYSPAAFRKAYAAAKARGDSTFKWKRPSGEDYTVAVKDAAPKQSMRSEPASEEPSSSMSSGPTSRRALGLKRRPAPTWNDARKAIFGTQATREQLKKENKEHAFSGKIGKKATRERYMQGYASGGSVKKYAGGGSIDGCASRGKTKGRFV